jgi:hypothetical protein
MGLFRRRFSDVVARQLDLFEGEHAEALDAVRRARRRHVGSDAEDAEETFGDYADQVEWAAEDLAALRDTYAGTLDDAAADAYRSAFARAVRRRFPALAGAVEDDDR